MKKILVVDDLPENVFMVQGLLEREGYEVITAYDGKSGLEKAVNEIPDLVLLDVMMPDMNGIEVCRKLVNDKKTSQIPIILVTAKSGAEDIKEGLGAGAFDYVKKPFNRVELLARVNSAVKLSETQKLLIESEMRNTFTATVVTANHKIKQPLTLMSLSATAIKRELNKETISKEAILKRLEYIENAVREINDVLNQLNMIKKPVFSEYVKNIKMVDFNGSSEADRDTLG
jgi:DNA-binding response OmpR family regulator